MPTGSTGSNTVELSTYIIAFAGAAAVAQKEMSTSEVPMAIKEYMFDINIMSDFTVNNKTDVELSVLGIGIKDVLTTNYESKMGIEIKCTIVPMVQIAHENAPS